MAETPIEWTDYTHNGWTGCEKISPGCKNCYAAEMDKWLNGGENWRGQRQITSDANWAKPLAWDRAAARTGVRKRVFTLSMGDVFEAKAPADQRKRLFELIKETPNLDWLILTKRPHNIAAMVPNDWGAAGYANVWLGTSVENSEVLDRINHLLRAPARLRFLSCEPLLGPLSLKGYFQFQWQCSGCGLLFAGPHRKRCDCGRENYWSGSFAPNPSRIDWVIIGGESGRSARPCQVGWVRNLVADTIVGRAAVFVKQLGAKPIGPNNSLLQLGKKGGNYDEWPPELRIRQIPKGVL